MVGLVSVQLGRLMVRSSHCCVDCKIISVRDKEAVSILELIANYIRNLANPKNTVVSVIQIIFYFLTSKYFRLSVTSFTYLRMTSRRSMMVRSLS